MVKVCSYNYPKENEDKYKHFYDKFKYDLHHFQKWTIEGIVEGHHVLVTAPTGSGKSFGAEFAIEYFCSIGKKVIYTSPIKSLSNQKFNDFTTKYPHVKVGIVTGDISCNSDADVIVMTTEVLLNKLYQIKSKNAPVKSTVSFEMDIENDLGCVIFDEVHMINNEDRGTVWENSIMLLPSHIQMVGLSATLDNPERFAYWLENRHNDENNILFKKEVYLTQKTVRAVPLIHYSFITATQGVFKAIKDKATQEEIKSVVDKPLIIQDAKNKLYEENFAKISKTLKLFENKNIRIKRAHVLNQVTKYLTDNEMTPAICYVFSIRQLEICAKEITTDLQEFDSKVPYIAKRECDKILRDKFPNCEEYFCLPEYLNLVALLEKGIATHHSKMLPVLREIVEIFFARGYIKLLFATESVAIGLNLPVKTCIFTDICKHDGSNVRVLYGHEYVQAAGRSGRLGLDSVGYVIHLNNLFRNVESVSYKTMMNGRSQILTSKFKISYNLLLNLIDTGDTNLSEFTRRSMISGDIDNQMKELTNKINKVQSELTNLNSYSTFLKTPVNIVCQYIELHNNLKYSVNKKRKEIERNIQKIKDEYKTIEQDQISYLKIEEKETEIYSLKKQYDCLNQYFESNVDSLLNLLSKDGFINNDTDISLTFSGKIASQIREMHCLVFAKLFEDKVLDELTPKQLVSFFSCFTNVKVNDELKNIVPYSSSEKVNNLVRTVEKMYDEYKDRELNKNIDTGFDYNTHYDLLEFTEKWCDCEDITDCKIILQELIEKKEIFLGEFVKALLKINNISCEFEKIAELTGNIKLLSSLKEIPQLTLKFVVTNQSLYI